jgi:hypothetical protein
VTHRIVRFHRPLGWDRDQPCGELLFKTGDRGKTARQIV